MNSNLPNPIESLLAYITVKLRGRMAFRVSLIQELSDVTQDLVHFSSSPFEVPALSKGFLPSWVQDGRQQLLGLHTSSMSEKDRLSPPHMKENAGLHSY